LRGRGILWLSVVLVICLPRILVVVLLRGGRGLLLPALVEEGVGHVAGRGRGMGASRVRRIVKLLLLLWWWLGGCAGRSGGLACLEFMQSL
jgi:hypothetical protein